MRFTVNDMLGLSIMEGARAVAGHESLEREVRAVAIMEVPDVVRWLSEGDVLLTTGYPLLNDPEAQVQLICDMARIRAAALAFKPRRFFQDIPSGMVQEAARLGLPLIEIPVDVNFTDVIKTVMAHVTGTEVLHRYRDEFVRDTLAGERPVQPDMLLRRAASFGFEPQQVNTVAVASGLTGPEATRDALVPFLQGVADKVITGVFDGIVAMVIPDMSKDPANWLAERGALLSSLKTAAKRAEATLRSPIRMGVGRQAMDMPALRHSYQTARQAHDRGVTILGHSYVLDYSDLGVYRVLLNAGPRSELEAFHRDMLGALIDYDREHDSNLVETLGVYLRCNGSKSEAARALFVHLNTLKHRLGRIQEVARVNLEDSEHRLSLHIALKISLILR